MNKCWMVGTYASGEVQCSEMGRGDQRAKPNLLLLCTLANDASSGVRKERGNVHSISIWNNLNTHPFHEFQEYFWPQYDH